ncbi:MAG: Maf family protein [Alphaproteobacteria bacterium]|nr:Maf family protein [Alphaproteobacteria bacterium]
MNSSSLPPVIFAGPAATATKLVLASASPVRGRLLQSAGIAFEQRPAAVDEEEMKAAMRAENAAPEDAAIALADLKAMRVSSKAPGALVIGADQILDCEGAWLNKPADRAAAAASLQVLSGRAHTLVSAACVVRDGQRLWHGVDRATLHMRALDADFIEAYLEAAGPGVLSSVGVYQLEALGAHLFTRIDGDYFTILGLPLLPLLAFLREHGVVP